ncbi:prenyltransferase [Cohnella lubricantis]|uniref:Prenyltransferase n=1 Tax=Cohnella lubricantis TaxID=2163172 RepID=A0A841TIW8_9BACL|nr:prenyltransferase [Cohnella lubricantis]MBB6679188.1 prenyltransferase [Cohnella lubricantis]MBP2120671.1 1,4-dihydroxy-2-naphthoate octaprenyltransferase [Cohnella lubricantis]
MGSRSRRVWAGFWQLADPKIWVASTVPMLVGAALAFAEERRIHGGWFALALVGIYLIEIGKNAVNEFVDYVSGVDRYVTADQRNPFSGGKKTIIDGRLLLGETFLIAVLTLVAAFFIGLSIAILREPAVFGIGMAGGVLAVFYSLPPFKLNYNGLGEAAVGITFGPLLVSGMYVMLTGELSWTIAAIGLPISFIIVNILWINQYPDFEADIRGGKRNWLVRIGRRTGIKVYAVLFACAYLSLLLLFGLTMNPYWLLGMLTIPLAVRAVRTAAANLDDLPAFLKANAATVLILQLVGAAMIAASLLGG